MNTRVHVLPTLLVIILIILMTLPSLASAQVYPAVMIQDSQTDECYYLEDRDVNLCYDDEYEEWYDDGEFVDESWSDDCYYLEDDDATVCYDVEWDFWYEEGEFFEIEDCYYLEDRDVELCYFADEDTWYDNGQFIDESWGNECYELDTTTVCYDVEADGWYEEGGSIPTDENFSDDWDDETNASADEVNATYFVGENLTLEGDVKPAHQAIWDVFISLFPAERLDGIFVSYEIFEGDDGTVAYVYNIDESLAEWVMGYNIDEAENFPEEIVLTLVHEYGHVLSLESSQMSDSDEASCATYYTGEGCVAPGSYLYAFYTEFWFGTETDAEGEGRASDYISEYATTNIAEDFAETFMTFVLNDRPSSNTVADQKVKFFYNYPELVSLRDHIRANME